MVPEIWCTADEIVVSHFGLFLALLPPNSPKSQNFEEMKKTLDGRTKKVTYSGGCTTSSPKKAQKNFVESLS